MTKHQFFHYCQVADRGEGAPHLQVTWRTDYEGLERAVYLNGSWCDRCIVFIELYRPTPGRQGADCYLAANRACEEACKKFQRWLEEYHAKD